jgi:hypothetical protein
MRFARDHDSSSAKNNNFSPSPAFSSPGFGRDAASGATSYTSDTHAVSVEEARSYYAGIPSQPALIYRTGKEQWSAPKGPEAYRRLKELLPVFGHPITRVWNEELGWKVVSIMDAHQVRWNPYYHRRHRCRHYRCGFQRRGCRRCRYRRRYTETH